MGTMEPHIKPNFERKNMSVEELAEEHWNYVKDLLGIHGEKSKIIDKIGFHYVTAFEHGYKHGVEDQE